MSRWLFIIGAAALVASYYWQQQQMEKKKVIVVGGGLAGLSAALEARLAGAEVVILEQEKMVGGNSAKASSGVSAVPTPAQKAQGVSDSWEEFVADTIKCGKGKASDELVNILAQESASAIAFLESEAQLDMSVLTIMGGHSHPRTHRAVIKGRPMNVGLAITSAVAAKVNASGVQIRTEVLVQEVLQTQGKVTGVRLQNGEVLEADSVVLATGGFSSNRQMLAQVAPEVAQLPSTNGLWKTAGTGIEMGKALGAQTVGMQYVQIHPTGLVSPADPTHGQVILAGEALRGGGALLIDASGKRFVDELTTRDRASAAIFKHGSRLQLEGGESPPAVFLVLNEAAVSHFAEAIKFYSFKKLVQRFDSLREFCEKFSIPVDEATATLRHYNEAAEKGVDEFGKTSFSACPWSPEQALTVLIVTPSVHYTMGGLAMDAQARVLSESGPISGLFAAGEVTGGVHGASRLGGNSLLECIIFGRRAGRSAAK